MLKTLVSVKFGTRTLCPLYIAKPVPSRCCCVLLMRRTTFIGFVAKSATSLTGTQSSIAGKYPYPGSMNSLSERLESSGKFASFSFLKNIRSARRPVGTRKAFTVSALAWEQTTDRVAPMVGGMRFPRRLPSNGGRASIHAGLSLLMQPVRPTRSFFRASGKMCLPASYDFQSHIYKARIIK